QVTQQRVQIPPHVIGVPGHRGRRTRMVLQPPLQPRGDRQRTPSRATQPYKRLQRGLAGREPAPADPSTATVRSGVQFEAQVPTAMAALGRQSRTPTTQGAAGVWLLAATSPV